MGEEQVIPIQTLNRETQGRVPALLVPHPNSSSPEPQLLYNMLIA